MKEFNLAQALAGDPVITRKGVAVSQLVLFNLIQSSFPLHGVLEEGVNCWTIHGRYGIDEDHDFDLFMAPVKRQEWCNIYLRGYAYNGYSIGVNIYNSQEAGIKAAENSKDYITTVLIREWEE